MFKPMPLAAVLLATSSLTVAAALVTEQASSFATLLAQGTTLSTTDTWNRRGSRDSSAAALPADRSTAALIQPRRGERAPNPTVADNAFDAPDALVRRGTR
jgi:hypothetical protein